MLSNDVTLADVIDLAVERNIPLKIVVVSGKWITKFLYQPNDKVFLKIIDHQDRFVCARWGFPAKCGQCDPECPQHHVVPVEVVKALTSFWQMVSSNADEATAVVEWRRSLLREVPGTQVVRFL